MSGGAALPLMAVQESKAGATIYLIDTETGVVYARTVESTEPQKLRVGDFKLVYRFSEPYHLTAAAYQDGKLFLCASQPTFISQPAVILQLDLESREVKLLWRGLPLRNPTSIAVSEAGEIAVADTEQRVVFWLESSLRGKHAVQRPLGLRADKRFAMPSRLLFAGYKLLVFDEKVGKIFSIDAFEDDKTSPTSVATLKFGKEMSRIKDFGFCRGVFYLADAKHVVTYKNGESLLSVVIKNTNLTNPSQIIATDSRLYVASNLAQFSLPRPDDMVVWNLPRPVPVSINLNADVPKSNEALIALYEYLDSQTILPLRKQEADQAYDSLEQMLLAKGLLILKLSGNEPIHNNPARDRLEALLYKLNPKLFGSSSDHPLATRIEAGAKVILPDISLSGSLTTGRINLNGKSVFAHLDERIPSKDERLKIDVKYLSRINPQYSRTIEGELSRYDFIAASPRLNLEAGTILNIRKGQEMPTATVSKCDERVQVKQEPLAFPEIMTSLANSEFLPRRDESAARQIDLAKLGVERIELHFDAAARETLDSGALTESFNKSEVRDCLRTNTATGNYVVLESLRVTGMRYRFISKAGATILPKDDLLRSWGIIGQADPEGKWSVVLNEPLYIGYRVAAWNPADDGPPSLAIIQDPGKIKPGSSQDIFSIASGTWTLPIMRWRLAINVNIDDLNNELSSLRKLESDYPGVRVNSKEDLPAVKSSYAVVAVARGADMEAVSKNRKTLKEDISYALKHPSGRGLIISIAETDDSVDRRHPDFMDDMYSAWFKIGQDGTADFEPLSASGAAPVEHTVKKFDNTADHGTHIAGLLAAREKSLTPGLLPASGLLLIDSKTSAKLQESIQDAVNHGVFLFNFSFTLPGDQQTANALRNLKIEMRDTWKDQLFIVAAGNENQDLRDYDLLPLKWIDEVKNMIGVGASIGRQSMLGNWEDDEGITRQGSNYSKKFIQLVAPGYRIYSTTPNNSYAEATGSSQAVPQVTAAAGMLWSKGITGPLQIKARLIYTADWFDFFDKKVWGGLLNVDRAVREPNQNYLSVQSSPKKIKTISVHGTPMIRVTAGKIDDPNDATVQRPAQISFHRILRIARLADGSFRVFYLDGSTLRVIMNAALDGTITCDQLSEWDVTTQTATETPDSRNDCRQGIRISTIFDYVAKVPPSVTF